MKARYFYLAIVLSVCYQTANGQSNQERCPGRREATAINCCQDYRRAVEASAGFEWRVSY
jgi:hypothetical protein